MPFDFATPARIIFGPGRVSEVGEVVAPLGGHALVVTGGTPGRASRLLSLLRGRGIDVITFSVTHEPDIDTIEDGAGLARQEQCDCVVGFGGGAALDAAKAIAACATNVGRLTDYLEVVGSNRPLAAPPLPVIAIPTTAGTGSEVTRNSVIIARDHRVKVSLRSPLMMPRVALVDPELTHELPPAITATTGMDALAQVIEPYVCKRANPLTDGLCREGMMRVARSLRRAFECGRDAGAREDMAVASLFGGLALANAGLGAVHGLAAPLGGTIEAPHGAICAALLPQAVAANLSALRLRDPDSDALGRYQQVAQLLTNDSEATADDAVVHLTALTTELGVPRLGSYGLQPRHVPELVDKAVRASSMKANPVELTHEELAAIVLSAL